MEAAGFDGALELGPGTHLSLASEGTSDAQRSYVPVREPELAELRAFCAAATLGSIAEAARAMNVSQPAMSKRLRSLESVVGTQLLERSARGVTLTPAGIRLYAAARRLLNSADTVQALITDAQPTLPVRLASSSIVAELWLPRVLTGMAASDDWVATEILTANSTTVRELVVEGRCDLGIAALDPYVPATDGLEERPLWRDEVVVLVPAGHPWEMYREIPLAEFAQTPLVEREPAANSTRVVATALEQSGIQRPHPAASIGSTAGVIQTALETGTPALISRDSARPHAAAGNVIRRVEGMRFKREFALMWSGHLLDMPAAVQAMARHLLELPFLQAAEALGQ